jgi:cation transport ATPase
MTSLVEAYPQHLKQLDETPPPEPLIQYDEPTEQQQQQQQKQQQQQHQQHQQYQQYQQHQQQQQQQQHHQQQHYQEQRKPPRSENVHTQQLVIDSHGALKNLLVSKFDHLLENIKNKSDDAEAEECNSTYNIVQFVLIGLILVVIIGTFWFLQKQLTSLLVSLTNQINKLRLKSITVDEILNISQK